MPPKKKAGGGASKKATEKAKIVEDKTFGLKNKNKSKKVQSYVKQVEQQAQHKVEGRRRGAGASNEDKTQSKKAMLAARLEELQLMNQPVAERPKKVDSDAEARRKAREAEEAERLRFANLPVEDQIEEERAKLTTRTPVTLELFNAWKKKKNDERDAAEAQKLAAAQKGMSKAERARGGGLTGRQLFEQHQDIFVDDADASDAKYAKDENAWIGDSSPDGEKGAAEAEGGSSSQNVPENEHEPPAGEDAEDVDVAVGDESLFS